MAPRSLVASDHLAFWHLEAVRGPSTPSFDDLVGARQKRLWHFEAERLRRLKIDHQFVLGRRLYGEVTRFLTFEDAVDVAGGAAELLGKVSPIGNQTAACDVIAGGVNRGQFVLGRKRGDQFPMSNRQCASGHN